MSSSMKYVQLYFDSNGIPNFEVQDSKNEIHHHMYPRKIILSHVKQSLNEWVANSSSPAMKIDRKCVAMINPSYLTIILLSIIFLFILDILVFILTRRRQRCVVDKRIVPTKSESFQLQENLLTEEEIREKRRKYIRF